MDSTATSFDLLRELESRHDELLVRLDELDKRVEKTLTECQVFRGGHIDEISTPEVERGL